MILLDIKPRMRWTTSLVVGDKVTKYSTLLTWKEICRPLEEHIDEHILAEIRYQLEISRLPKNLWKIK